MQKKYIQLGNEEVLKGTHLLAVFKVIPYGKTDLLDAASEIAAESSNGSNIEVNTATEFSDSMGGVVYKVEEDKGLVYIAYPWRMFDRAGNVQNIVTFLAGNVFGMSSLAGLKLLDISFPPDMLENYDGSSYTIDEMRKYLNAYDRPILGTIVKPKIGLKSAEYADVCYNFWAGGGDFVKNDEPQADQDFAPFTETVDLVKEAMDKAETETGQTKVHSFNVSAADFDTMIERADYVQKIMKPDSYAFLVDGITAGWTAVQTIRRRYPDVYLHFHRAGHGAFTREENPIGFSVLVLTKLARLAGASGIHTGTSGIGKMSGSQGEDVTSANSALGKITKGHFFEQDWGDLKKTNPIISGGMNPVLLRPFIEAIGHTDFIITMGAGVHSHPDGTKAGAAAVVQACTAWKQDISIEEYSKNYPELARAIEFFNAHETQAHKVEKN
ncbi:ribulose-bisphosphate carboxylase [Candidatus Dojkabacteria bacterium]|nr:ribulose-bisphosphate carboxylase [Candidatus Dojkabacteria bacterium]